MLLSSLAVGCTDTADTNISVAPGAPPPAVAAAKDVIVYASNGQLIQVDRKGQNRKVLTTGFEDSDPFFGPTGRNLVFIRRSPGGQLDLFRAAPDLSELTNLTATLDFDAFEPDVAWDGSFVVFTVQVAPGDSDIYICKPDGTDLRRLTQGADQDTDPAPSPDGKEVVFARALPGGKSKICKVNIAGGTVVDLTSGLFTDLHPVYLSGDTVVFSRDGNLLKMKDTHVPGDLASLAPAGSGIGSVQTNADQNAIYFIAQGGGVPKGALGKGATGEIFSTTLDGETTTQLTQGAQANSFAVAPTSAPGTPPNEVTVELVNDSGLPDSDVYLLLDTPEETGQDVQAPPTLLTASGKAGSSGTAVAFNTLHDSGLKERSRYTGQLHTIYTITVRNLESGHFKISYKTPVKIVNGAAPTAHEKYRFDKLELTYKSADKGGGGNLTSIDFFGIPLEVTVTHFGQNAIDPLQTKTFAVSTPTFLKTLNALGANMKNAVLDVDGNAFDPANPTDLTKFARVLSPNTIAADAGSNGSPAPYPTFAGYLDTLVGKTFTFNGEQHGGYKYHATFSSDGNGGYLAKCTGTLNQAPGDGLPNNAEVTINFPKGKMDFFIYACVPNIESYSIAGFPFGDDDDVKKANASAYGSLVGDVQAALNFGYLQGKFGDDIDRLYKAVVLPYPYPFAGARTTNDGFYNPYAALLYYLTDAYGHPYSDRILASSPLYTFRSGDTVRIKVLNDTRLDAPVPTVESATDTSLHLTWPAVPGASSYQVEVSPPPELTPGPAPVGLDPVPYDLHNLKPGTPYLISVKAIDLKSADYRESASLPVQGVTTGTREKLDETGNPNAISFQASINLIHDYDGYKHFINETLADPNAIITGALGLNIFGLRIEDPQGETVYQGNFFFNAIADALPDKFRVGTPFEIEYNLTALGAAPPQDNYPRQGAQMVLGTSLTTKPYYKFFQTLFPK